MRVVEIHRVPVTDGVSALFPTEYGVKHGAINASQEARDEQIWVAFCFWFEG